MVSPQEILLIEDDIAFSNTLVTTLKAAHYVVQTACNAQRGLEILGQAMPDLILVNPFLPDISGYEILYWVRAYSRVPVVFISSLGTRQDRIAALDQGADDFLCRPIHPEELLARLSARLRRANMNPVPEIVLDSLPATGI